MKLLSCHIENFGGLSDFRLRFEDDITVIMEENGWGKTTLSAFLLSMFYGLPQRGKDSARERARFLPWKGGTCGGSLTFAHRGTAYRILRTFGTGPAKDTFRLYDLQTGFASEDFSERIGEELFGIDRASFLRTAFVTSDSLLFPGSAAPDPTASIQARISGLAPGAEDLTQYEGAAKRLRKEIARLSPDRPSGELARAKSALDSLAARASGTEAAAEAVRECAARLDEEKAALVQLQRDRDDLLRRSADEEGAREAAILLDHYDSLRRQVREAGEALDPAPVEDSTQQTDKIHAQKTEYIRTRKALSKVRHAINDASQEEAAARTALLAGACVTVLLAALGTAAAILDIASPLLPGLFAAAALGAALFTFSRRPKQETRDHLRALYEREEQLSALLSRQKARLRASLTDTSRGRAVAANGTAEKARRALADFRREHDVDLLRKRARRADTGASDTDPYTLSGQLRRMEDEISGSRRRLQLLSDRLEEARGQLRQCEEAAAERNRILTRMDALRGQYDTLVRTADYLKQAHDALTARCMDPFREAFLRYCGTLSDIDPERIFTDAALSVSVSMDGVPREFSSLSTGTRELLELCRRMAMLDAMYPQEKPFLILDDPFANMDDEHLEKALTLLRDIGLSRQAVYFTCHSSRLP